MLSGIAGVGMCWRPGSQSIVVDKGLTSFKTAAHELGHKYDVHSTYYIVYYILYFILYNKFLVFYLSEYHNLG